MKVLFLDIDGVVNCKTTTQRHRGAIGIDPYMAFLVGKIQLNTGCEVVLSSSWKNWPEGINEVERQVINIFDRTPNLNLVHYEDKPRGNEIKRWLDRHPEVEAYAILDDNSDMLDEQLPHFFKTSWDTGITEEIATRVTDYLNGGGK
jgi:hypothetical protein